MKLKFKATICPHCGKDSEEPRKQKYLKLRYKNDAYIDGMFERSKLTGDPRPYAFVIEKGGGVFFCRDKEELEKGMEFWKKYLPKEITVKVTKLG